jgi:hypothetical protein
MGRNLHGRVVCMHSQPTPLGRPGRLGRVCSTVLLAQQANREPNAVCPAATSDFRPNQPNEKASFASLIIVVRGLKFQTQRPDGRSRLHSIFYVRLQSAPAPACPCPALAFPRAHAGPIPPRRRLRHHTGRGDHSHPHSLLM